MTWLKQRLKKEYFRKALAEAKGNSKKLWGRINEAFGKSSGSAPITEINGKTDEVDMANEINDYFTGIADKLSDNFEGVPI